MTRYVGIDGCKGGWLFCHWDGFPTSAPRIDFADSIDRLELTSTTMVAIDVPIGLLETPHAGGRTAEQSVRRFLPGKTSSVFSAPCRKALRANSFEEALEINRNNSLGAEIGLSKQSAAIIPKIREVDSFITIETQSRLVETHPEAAFAVMNGDMPVLSKKRRAEGQAERRRLLAASRFPIANLRLPNFVPKRWATNDILDACACSWVAKRVHAGTAYRFPADPPRDARGLRMEINA